MGGEERHTEVIQGVLAFSDRMVAGKEGLGCNAISSSPGRSTCLIHNPRIPSVLQAVQ